MKNTIILIFVFCITLSVSQNKKFIKFPNTDKKYSYVGEELDIDSAFIANINDVLFSELRVEKNVGLKRNKHLWLSFEEMDTINYMISVMVWDTPLKQSVGFYVYNGFFYWFGKSTPICIVLGKKSKKRFSYKEELIGFIDPLTYLLIYNSRTGNIRILDDAQKTEGNMRKSNVE